MLFDGTPLHILVIYRRTPHAVTSLLQLSPCSMRCVFSAVILGLHSILPHPWQIPGMPWGGMLQCWSRLGDKPTLTLVCIWEIMVFKILYQGHFTRWSRCTSALGEWLCFCFSWHLSWTSRTGFCLAIYFVKRNKLLFFFRTTSMSDEMRVESLHVLSLLHFSLSPL